MELLHETLQTFLNLLHSLTSPNYLLTSISILLIFIFTTWLYSRPFSRYFSGNVKRVIWPLLGFANLALTLSYAAFLRESLGLSTSIVTVSAIALVIQLIVFKLPQAYPPQTLNPTRFKSKIIWLIYLGLYFLFTARFYHPQYQQFFVPGYDTNHDSINILSSVKLLDLGLPYPDHIGTISGGNILAFYPLGSTYLTHFYSQLAHLDPYTVYPLLITAIALLTLFSLPLMITFSLPRKQFPSAFIYLAAFLGIFNYFTIAFINSGVFASTTIIGLQILTLTALFGLIHQKLSRSQAALIIFISLSASAFIYAFVPIVFFLLFTVSVYLFFRTGFTKTTLLIIATGSVIALSSPHFFFSQLGFLTFRLTSGQPEVNLLSATRGNTIGYPHPLQILSFWYSHRNYLLIYPRFGNQIIGFLLAIALLFIGFKSNTAKKRLTAAIFLPFIILYSLSLFFSHSPYQAVKISQQLAPFLPMFILMVLFPLTNFSKKALLAIYLFFAIISATISFSFATLPNLESDQDLVANADQICQIKAPILLLTQDEWATYRLFDCKDIFNYFDRRSTPVQLIKLSQINQIDKYNPHCQTSSYILPDYLPQHYPYILSSRCLEMNLPGYQLVKQFNHYRLYSGI